MRKPRFPATLPAEALAAPDGGALPAIRFDPVPRLRARRSGWTPDRQRGFIAALARCGSVAAAAKHVGMTPRTAYRLLDAPGAASFAAAWDQAIGEGYATMQVDALERALAGTWVPIYRRGQLVRVEHRRCDRLAIALLGGQSRDIGDIARSVRRHEHARDLAAYDERKAADAAAAADRQAAYDAELEAMLARAAARRVPRVRAI